MHYCLKRIKEFWPNYEEIEMIAAHHPSDALKIIKADAKANKGNWKKKPVYHAIKATTIALQALGRDNLAKTIASTDNYVW